MTAENTADPVSDSISDSAAPAWLRAEVPTTAWCWRLSRRDGAVIALTSHDRDLMVAGNPFRAAPGMRPSAIETRDDLGAASIDIDGAISSNALSEADIDSGRWDGAQLQLSLVDWSNPLAEPVLLVTGTLGVIERRGAAFTVELKSGVQALEYPVAPHTSPSCRADLGDKLCRVDLAPRTHRTTVIALAGREAILAQALPANSLPYGEMLWLEGPWTGLASRILTQDNAKIGLAIVPPKVPTPALDGLAGRILLPLRVEIREGCDGQLATCRNRFANTVNFRGEAHLPGNDLLTRFPGT